MHDRVPDVRRIAVLRANGLGDLVFSLPALAALRGAYPEAALRPPARLGRALRAPRATVRRGP